MTEQMPKDKVQQLRQVAAAVISKTYPQWWVNQSSFDGMAWVTLLSTAADELEQMQKLNGKLYKTLYPD